MATELDKTYSSILDVLVRAISIFIQEIRENDLEVISNFKKLATGNIKIFYICPPGELDREFPTGLRFDFGLMNAWFALGTDTARDIVTNNPNGNFPFPRIF